ANVAPGKFALFASSAPDASWAARVQIVFGDNRASRANYCDSQAALALSHYGYALCRPRDSSSGTLLRFVNASEVITAFSRRSGCSRGGSRIAPARDRQFAAAPVCRGLEVAAGLRRPTWLPPFAGASPSTPRRARHRANQDYGRRISPPLPV